VFVVASKFKEANVLSMDVILSNSIEFY